jgi:branched-chain amino acid transport system permease protein
MSELIAGSVRVDRYRTRVIVTLAVAGALLVFFALAPYIFQPSITSSWIKLFYLITLATMWNLLAGYAGMVSVGQQAYIGLGAYGLFVFNDLGADPYSSAIIASIVVGAIALPVSFVAFRLRGGYFAIGTWVIAEVARQIVIRFDTLGAGRGRSISDYTADPIFRNLFTYWLALGIVALALGVTFYLLRSRLGIALQSIRDNEIGARTVGVNVNRTKRVVFVIAAIGGSLAGAVICLQAIGVASPSQIFSVSYSAFMIFMVLIGGIGTIEGPILGAVIYFFMDLYFSQLGLWYLVVLGLLAILVTLFLPKGIWGEISERFGVTLFPVGRRVVPIAAAGDEDHAPFPADRADVQTTTRAQTLASDDDRRTDRSHLEG